MVANGNRQRVGCVEKLRIQVFAKQMPDHVRHLIFTCVPVARHRLFNTSGRVFHDRNIARQGSGHHNPLRPAQLQHGLHVFTEEWVFNRHLVGVVLIDQPQNGFVEFLELQLVGRIFAQLNNAMLNHSHHARFNGNDAITGDLGAWVDSQNNLFWNTAFRGNVG